jgi:putative endonuclease
MPAADSGGIDRRARGAAVERAARMYLADAGLRPLAANVNYRCGELDLVMLDADRWGEVVVFVEVRFRGSDDYGGGAASIDGAKRRKLVQAAQLFLLRHKRSESACRFDVVEASGDPGRPALHWIRDAFRADD